MKAKKRVFSTRLFMCLICYTISMVQKIIQTIISGVAILAFGYVAYGATWVGPTAPFPGGNPALPLDTASKQTKTDTLTLDPIETLGKGLVTGYKKSIAGKNSQDSSYSIFYPLTEVNSVANHTLIQNNLGSLYVKAKSLVLWGRTESEISNSAYVDTVEGALVYNKTAKDLVFYDGSQWVGTGKAGKIQGEGRLGVERIRWVSSIGGFASGNECEKDLGEPSY